MNSNSEFTIDVSDVMSSGAIYGLDYELRTAKNNAYSRITLWPSLDNVTDQVSFDVGVHY
jgi:hypothetical protein